MTGRGSLPVRSLWAVLACSLIPAVSHGALFVTTGQTGAQVQCDTNHTQYWTYSVNKDVSIDGALFTMKKGSKTSATITFSIIQGSYSDYGNINTSILFSQTLTPTSFNQSFGWVPFSNTPVTMLGNTTYTGVLASSAVDSQDLAYFIKSGTLFFVNESGVAVDPGVVITSGPSSMASVVPEPGMFMLLGVSSGVCLRRPRKRVA